MAPDNVFNSGDEDRYEYKVMTHELRRTTSCT